MKFLSKNMRRTIKRRIKHINKKMILVSKKIKTYKQNLLKNIRNSKSQIKKNAKRYNKQLTEIERKNIVCAIVLIGVSIALGISVWSRSRPMKIPTYSTVLSESKILETRMLFAGDVYWGRDMNKWSQKSSRKEGYPFKNLNKFGREGYDAWVANLECPSVPGVKFSLKQEKEKLEFNCPVSYLSEASKWFNVFSLANNHTSNYKKEEGLNATRKALDKHGIQYFGHFDPSVGSDACEVIEIPVRVRLAGIQQSAKLPVAMCGFAGVNYELDEKDLEPIKTYSKYIPVIVMPHMGTEYQQTVDTKRQELYRKMIDYGADMVLGNHPHWVQPSEAYKGKLIVYSMGNFIFDQQFSAEVTRSAAVEVIMSVDKVSISEKQLQAWLNFGDRCRVFHDECLEKMEGDSLKRLPFNFSFGIIGVQTSKKTTRLSNERTYNSILERLNWGQTINELSANAITEE